MTNLKRLAIIAVFAILATACSTPQPIKGKGTHPSTNNSSATINNLLLQAKSATFLESTTFLSILKDFNPNVHPNH